MDSYYIYLETKVENEEVLTEREAIDLKEYRQAIADNRKSEWY